MIANEQIKQGDPGRIRKAKFPLKVGDNKVSLNITPTE